MGFFDIIKAIIPLVIMIGLLYGVLYLVKKYTMPFSGKKLKAAKINILSTQAIMPKKYLSIVQVQGKVLLLGVSDHSVNLIKELDAIELNEEDESQPIIIKNNFADILKKNLGIR
jgi:flagellar protein FliO/FliZ